MFKSHFSDMAEELNTHLLPVKEESTQHSDKSHTSSSRKGPDSYPKSQTYSKADQNLIAGASVHSYSEMYESATRESIDETTDDLKQRLCSGNVKKVRQSKAGKSTTRRSVTWTTKYTPEQIDKSRNRLGWDELVNLEQLHSLQMINTVEYRLRRQKLIDSMTGTRVNVETEDMIQQLLDDRKNPPQKRVLGETEIIQKVVDFRAIPTERAIRHSCHIRFIRRGDSGGGGGGAAIMETAEEWSQSMRTVKMANNPFNNGTLRYVYYMQDVTEKKGVLRSPSLHSADDGNALQIGNTATHVAKVSIDPMEEEETYFYDVAMQNHAQRFADEFNKQEVPKKVGFLDCWVYELVDRRPHIFCGVEELITGEYHKYTNNWDWVNQSVDRNTPSAFSHFTYQASGHRILICDLQGVGDLYTDPQMHTVDGKGCGKGNMGKRGIEKFLSAHRCNAICTYLKLPHTNLSSQFTGTLPQKRYMNNEHIDQVPVTTGQYTVPERETSTHYGATTKSTYKTTVNQQYATGTAEYESDDEEMEGAYPFGKRLPDHEDEKCWCCLL